MKLGNLIELFTKYTGIKWFVKNLFWLFGNDCGCDKRKDKLNNIIIDRNGIRKIR